MEAYNIRDALAMWMICRNNAIDLSSVSLATHHTATLLVPMNTGLSLTIGMSTLSGHVLYDCLGGWSDCGIHID